MGDRTETGIPGKVNTNLLSASHKTSKGYIYGQLCTEGKKLSVVGDKSLETAWVHIRGNDIAAQLVQHGKVILELLRVLVECRGNEAGESLRQRSRACPFEGHRQNVGCHAPPWSSRGGRGTKSIARADKGTDWQESQPHRHPQNRECDFSFELTQTDTWTICINNFFWPLRVILNSR